MKRHSIIISIVLIIVTIICSVIIFPFISSYLPDYRNELYEISMTKPEIMENAYSEEIYPWQYYVKNAESQIDIDISLFSQKLNVLLEITLPNAKLLSLNYYDNVVQSSDNRYVYIKDYIFSDMNGHDYHLNVAYDTDIENIVSFQCYEVSGIENGINRDMIAVGNEQLKSMIAEMADNYVFSSNDTVIHNRPPNVLEQYLYDVFNSYSDLDIIINNIKEETVFQIYNDKIVLVINNDDISLLLFYNPQENIFEGYSIYRK